MAVDDAHRMGYGQVDDDPNASVLVAAMDATAKWEATRRLRAWERGKLGLERGHRLLDVGLTLLDEVRDRMPARLALPPVKKSRMIATRRRRRWR